MAVIIPIDELAKVQRYNSVDELRDGVSEYFDAECQIFVFQGVQHQISVGPCRYLVTADGEKVPLFDLPDPENLEVQESGYLGTYEHTEEDDEEDVVQEEEPEEEAPEDSDYYGEEDEDDDVELSVHDPEEEEEDDDG